MTKAIICDLDDLLVNSSKLHTRAFNAVLEEYGLKLSVLNPEVLDSFFGRRISDIIDTIYDEFPNLSIDKTIFRAKRDDCFFRLVDKELEPMPGFDKFVERFRSIDLIRCLASSGGHGFLDKCINKFGLQNFFHHIVSGDDVKRGKPDPEIFMKAADACRVDPQNCVVLEDAPAGIEAAKKAGMKCIAVRNPFTPRSLDLSRADVIVDSLADIDEELINEILQ